MKYINLLPPELQVKSTVIQRKAKPFSKGMLGCLIVPCFIIVASFLAIIVIQYNYKQEITETKNQAEPESTVVEVTARQIKRRRTVSKAQPIPAAENAASKTIVSPKPQINQPPMAREAAGGFTLHIASFTTKDEAEAVMQKLIAQEFEPYQQSRQATKPINTICIDQSVIMEDAMELSRRLETHGYEAFIKLQPQGDNLVCINEPSSRVKSEELVKHLLTLGYLANIITEQAPLTVYQVYLGHYKEYRQSKDTQNQLEKLGYQFISIIRE